MKCPSASLCLYRKLPLPSATGSRGSMARKWLRISLFTSVSTSLCWQVAAASNDTSSSACLWARVHTHMHAVSAARRTNPLPVGRTVRVTGLWATCRSWLLGKKKKLRKICNNIGNWVGGRGGKSAACCRRAVCHPACCDLWHGGVHGVVWQSSLPCSNSMTSLGGIAVPWHRRGSFLRDHQ